MAKRGDEWFPLSHAVVAYDHARHANLGDVITLDFLNSALEPGARAGVELTLETAKELRAALDRAIAAAEFEEAEVRGKGGADRVSCGRRNSSGVISPMSSRTSERQRARSGTHSHRVELGRDAVDRHCASLRGQRGMGPGLRRDDSG